MILDAYIKITLINKKNDRYRDWKSTTDNILYEIKNINFKTFEKIVNNEITAAKSLCYFNTFTAQKNDMKKLGLPSMKH